MGKTLGGLQIMPIFASLINLSMEKNSNGYHVDPNNVKSAGLGALITLIVVGIPTLLSFRKQNKKHQLKAKEMYEAGKATQLEEDNRQLSRVNAMQFTNLHCYAIGKAVCQARGFTGQRQPRVMSDLERQLRKSDNVIVQESYERIQHHWRSVSDCLRAYSEFLQMLEPADRNWSLPKVAVFMHTLANEMKCEVEPEWESFYNYNKES